jgi:hypothetical protein
VVRVNTTTATSQRPRALGTSWTPYDPDEVRRLAAEGLSVPEMARHFGRNRAGLYAFCARHGIVVRGRTFTLPPSKERKP